MNMIWLSYPLDINGPRPPAIPAPSLEEFLQIETDGASVHKLTVYSHTGTHLDTAAHVFSNGISIVEFRPNELVFRQPVVIDLPLPDCAVVQPGDLAPFRAQITGADMLLVRFGRAEMRRRAPGDYCTRCPGFGRESAEWLRGFPRLRCVGIDVPSFACIADLARTMSAHNVFLAGSGCRLLIIEEMKLDADLSGLREVRVSPWLVEDMHSGPCTVVGVLD